MKLQLADKSKTEALLKRALFLAWEACGGTFGMGAFQNRPSADEDAVWWNVVTRGDYLGAQADAARDYRKGKVYADYTFGRMMKLSLEWNTDDGTITVPDSAPRSDYQSWCRKYRTYADLIEAAAASLNAQLSTVAA
jgi:hypothetical protein